MSNSDMANNNLYIEYQYDDYAYFGAAKVVEIEKEIIKERNKRDPSTGLALSGGGIRSASFALGILQALSHKGWLEKIDYLSTVSGGGYIGSCLNYLLNTGQTLGNNQKINFGLDRNNFPLACHPMVGFDEKNGTTQQDAQESTPSPKKRYRGNIMRHLRQNPKYLQPGDGITILSLFGVLLRNSILSLIFFLGCISLMFASLMLFGLLPYLDNAFPQFLANNFLFCLLKLMVALFIALVPFYALITWCVGKPWPRRKESRFILSIFFVVIVFLDILLLFKNTRYDNFLFNFTRFCHYEFSQVSLASIDFRSSVIVTLNIIIFILLFKGIFTWYYSKKMDRYHYDIRLWFERLYTWLFISSFITACFAYTPKLYLHLPEHSFVEYSYALISIFIGLTIIINLFFGNKKS